ncbi:MAG: hypothetical protein H6839_14015 [Planctomycetes bacterium]|nr:hypothetical protein [Planctomycetota bacterium]
MNPLDWVRVGAPLVEQDAEFLQKLISDAGLPARLKHLPDIADGHSVVVLAHRQDHRAALAIREQHFRPSSATVSPRAKSLVRQYLPPAAASVAGFAAGAPLGWLARGSVLLALVSGCALAFCGMLLSVGISVARFANSASQSAPTTQESPQAEIRNREVRKRDV